MTQATKKRTKKAAIHAPIGAETKRGAGGEIEMVILNPWQDNPMAPIIMVNGLGGIQRISDGLVQCTFIREIRMASGASVNIAASHLIWPERRWLDTGDAFKWIMQEFQAGTFRSDDGFNRRTRTQ